MKLSEVQFSGYRTVPGIPMRQGVSLQIPQVKSIQLLEPAMNTVRVETSAGICLIPWSACIQAIELIEPKAEPAKK